MTDNDLKDLPHLLITLARENREQFPVLQKEVSVIKQEVTDLKISASKIARLLKSQTIRMRKIPDSIKKVRDLKHWQHIAIVTVTAVINSIIPWFIRFPNLTP